MQYRIGARLAREFNEEESMTRAKIATLTAVVAALLGAPVSRAQDMPPMPKPGPEHEVLKGDVGTWNAKVEMVTPGGPVTSTGVETNRLGCGGLCLVSDFKGEMMPGVTFEGHGMSAYDAQKKKYVGTWSDSMSQGIAVGESTWDPATKTMNGTMEGPDASGGTAKMKTVVEYKDPNTRVFTMYMPDGKPGMKITYTRKM
jgi:hypothetical protein